MRISTVTERDLDVWMKTSVQGREVITRSDLKVALANAFQEALEIAFLQQAAQKDMTQYGTKQQQKMMSEAFGNSQQVQGPVPNPFEL